MVAVEDPRTAARRIVEQVLAERGASGPARAPSRAARTAAPTADDSPARRTARRIVDEVLAAQASTTATLARAPAETAVSEPEVVVELDDDHPLTTAGRIVERALREGRVQQTVSGAAGLDGADGPHDHVEVVSEPLAEQLFVGGTDAAEATVPTPIPDPGPSPEPGPGPVPDPGPGPMPDPGPGPMPDPAPRPMPDPDPFPPEPEPVPPDPEPQPLSTDGSGDEGPSPEPAPTAAVAPVEPAASSPPPSPERRVAEDIARRIVDEVVAAHERAVEEREAAARARDARLTEQAVVAEEAGLIEEAQAAEQARLDQVAADAEAAEGAARLAVTQGPSGPYLDELPHPEAPHPPTDGPPPVPDAARRAASGTGSVGALPPPDTAPARERVPTAALTRGERRPPRTGRWLITTVVGAVALALLFPLAVAALRSLVTLG